MHIEKNQQYINELWDSSIIPTLEKYIRIPNKSPLYDANWKENGYMDAAVKLLSDWCHKHAIENMALDVVQLPGRTPVIFIEVPGSSDETILLYGHLDKQPEMTGWEEGLGPWQPVIKNERLYGRGGADDGYAIFASLAAIKSLHEQGLPHARCVILIEACEESGSRDLPFYIEALEKRIGKPNLVICLDSGSGNYEQLWITTSLRGMVGGVLSIDVLKEGIHSGMGSGIVPSCFMVLRQLLERIEDKTTGKILLQDLVVNIPEERIQQAKKTAAVLNDQVLKSLPFHEGVKPVSDNLPDLLINRTWRAALSVTGLDGLPKPEDAGNVTVPSLKVKLSFRLPPTCDDKKAIHALKEALESHPPFNANVQFNVEESAAGWSAPLESAWLSQAANEASQHYFGKDAMHMGEGASIPFMGMLGEKFPEAQFLITGVLGPNSNAHGPNEFLHIPMGKKLTCCIAEVIEKHFTRQT
jgi:acetylornithine deacetylase/succinyl-diaminopimelate desuccinylase-like protein